MSGTKSLIFNACPFDLFPDSIKWTLDRIFWKKTIHVIYEFPTMNRVENTVPWHPCHIPAVRRGMLCRLELYFWHSTAYLVGLCVVLLIGRTWLGRGLGNCSNRGEKNLALALESRDSGSQLTTSTHLWIDCNYLFV